MLGVYVVKVCAYVIDSKHSHCGGSGAMAPPV